MLLDVTTDEEADEVMVDISEDIFTIEGEALAQAFAQIVWTATEPGAGGYRQVRFSVDGEPTHGARRRWRRAGGPGDPRRLRRAAPRD